MQRILFATDGSDDAESARKFLAALPLPAGTTIRVLTVMGPITVGLGPTGDPLVAQVERNYRDWLRRIHEESRQVLAREGVEVTTAVRTGEPAHQILAAAEEFEADLIVVGTKGLTGPAGFFLGSVARNVAKHARRPVLVAQAPRHGLKRVVVAVDASEHARRAVEFAARAPLPQGTEMVVTHVVPSLVPPLPFLEPDPGAIDGLIREARRRSQDAGMTLVDPFRTRLEEAGWRAIAMAPEGDPAHEILRIAEESEADLVIAGSRGVSLIQGLVVGSVADRLLRGARCSVLLVQ